MVGEIGGDEEEKAAAFIEAEMTKPVVAYIAGFTAPPGKTMGHAGAIISGSAGTAQAKKDALEARGIRVGTTPTETARARRRDRPRVARAMQLRNRERDAEPFVTKDGSTIREYFHSDAQSLAEASLEPGRATQRHYHARSEEIYLIVEGGGELEVDGDRRARSARATRSSSRPAPGTS